MATEPRALLKSKTKALTIDELVKLDAEKLMEDPAFLRFMFTTFRDCHMYSGSFHSEAGFQHYAEGRRSLGLDMLRRLEDASPDAHLRILSEAATHKEANNGRRNNYDRARVGTDDGLDDPASSGPVDATGAGVIRY